MSGHSVTVIDASVAVEYLVEMALTEQATALFRRLTEQEPAEFWAPDLIYLEVASAIRKLTRAKSISSREGERAIRRLLQLPIRTASAASLLLDIWTLRGRLTPYDGAYVLLARELAAPLITADRRLARAVPRGVQVQLLQDVA